MSATVTVDFALRYQDSQDQVMQGSSPSGGLTITPAATNPAPVDLFQTIGQSEESINLGDCTAPGMCLITNLDETNNVKLRTGTGGKYFATLLPNEAAPAMFYASDDTQAPWAIALNAPCKIRVRLTPA